LSFLSKKPWRFFHEFIELKKIFFCLEDIKCNLRWPSTGLNYFCLFVQPCINVSWWTHMTLSGVMTIMSQFSMRRENQSSKALSRHCWDEPTNRHDDQSVEMMLYRRLHFYFYEACLRGGEVFLRAGAVTRWTWNTSFLLHCEHLWDLEVPRPKCISCETYVPNTVFAKFYKYVYKCTSQNSQWLVIDW